MNWNPELKEISPKAIALTLAVLMAGGGLIFGARAYFEHRASRSLTPSEVRAEVTKYLRKKSGRSNFQAGADLNLQTNLVPTLRAQYESVPDYKTVYGLIGQHLHLAERLVNSSERPEQQAGLRALMFLAETAALEVAVDEWLAASICEGYIVPNLEKAIPLPRRRGQERGQELAPDAVIRFVLNIYRQAEAREKQIGLYETLLAKAQTPERADSLRLRMADALEIKGDHKQALDHLREISSANFTNAAARRIAMIEGKTVASKSARR
jgi:tetratricopeptide (TPR) repeat protein